MSSPARARALISCSLLALSFVGLGSTPARSAAAARAWDFNGDGRRDLAVGSSGEDEGAGAVFVLRGTSAGISTTGVQRWSQATAGVPGAHEAGDRFGASLASGDFDGDGYADLAIGAPSETVGAFPQAGAVTILYGTSRGLSTAGAHLLDRPNPEFGEDATFGYHMIAADFDHDGDHDLVVATQTGPGAILVYRGRSAGLNDATPLRLGPGSGLPDPQGFVISDMAIGDLNNDGVSDLALGQMEADQAKGAVTVAYGRSGYGLGVTGTGVPDPQLWTQDSSGVPGVGRNLDAFGASVDIGDVTGNGVKDLVVSSLQEPTEVTDAQGAIHVFRGSSTGARATGWYVEHDELLAGATEAMGEQLAVGDLNGDGIAEIAVTHGAPVDAPNLHRSGKVLIMRGTGTGLGNGTKIDLSQASKGIGGILEPVDYWGSELVIRDAGKSGTLDLIVSDPFEDVGGDSSAGLVNIIWGSSSGFDATSSRALTQDRDGFPGGAEQDDAFGSAI